MKVWFNIFLAFFKDKVSIAQASLNHDPPASASPLWG